MLIYVLKKFIYLINVLELIIREKTVLEYFYIIIINVISKNSQENFIIKKLLIISLFYSIT
jgi:hypothetical protein